MEEKIDREFNEGERLYIGKTIAAESGVKEHFERYEFVKKYLKPDFIVLDAACGTGYGTDILSNSVKKVIGLEISEHALNWAKEHYKNSNIEFKQTDLNKSLDLPDNYFDTVVSFETLEHVENQENMLGEFKRVLKPGGLLIISSPDREIITGKSGSDNKFHIKELSKKEFIDLMKKYFGVEEIFGQTKYVELPLYKQLLKLLVKLDVFKFRRAILRVLGLTLKVHDNFTPISYGKIQKVDWNSENDFYVLIMVCIKK